jgi:hypothetical protein
MYVFMQYTLMYVCVRRVHICTIICTHVDNEILKITNTSSCFGASTLVGTYVDLETAMCFRP